MLIQFYKYNIKKKKVYYSLFLYFIFLQYKILYFLQIDNIKYNIYFNINPLVNYIKINSSYLLSLFKNTKNKFSINIFKNNLFLIFSNNFLLLENIKFLSIVNNLVMISLNYFFINVKYLYKINILYKLFKNNFMIYIIFILKLFFVIKYYIYHILKNNLYNIL